MRCHDIYLKTKLALAIAATLLLQTPLTYAADDKAEQLRQRAMIEFENLSTREASLQHINQAIKLDPKRAYFWECKALILERMDEAEEALPCVEKALKLNPKNPYSWKTKAEILADLQRNDEALECANEGVKLAKGDQESDCRLTRAKILRLVGKADQAEKELDLLVIKRPNDDIVRSRRLEIARKLKHWPKVIEDSSRIIALKKGNFSNWTLLEHRAQAYVETKQYEKAIADFNEILKHSPDMRQAHVGLLKVYKIVGNKKGAEEQSKALKSLDDDLMGDYKP